jgi:peptidoglycan/xylan/chitin deacetylase (PgdA/CDA1 family)
VTREKAPTNPDPTTTPRHRVVVTTSWDDGHHLDTRLAELLARYDLPGTFYIAQDNFEIEPGARLAPAEIRDLATAFEIGGHTRRHLPLPGLTEDQAREEIRSGKLGLEDLLGTPVTSFCYPRGEYEPVHVRLAAEAGFEVARTVRRSSLSAGAPLEMTTTMNAYQHLVDGPLALRLAGTAPWRAVRYFTSWDEMAIRWFDLCVERGGVYHLWGHSWEVDARGDWQRLERVLDHICRRPGVTYTTNGAVPGLTGEAAR